MLVILQFVCLLCPSVERDYHRTIFFSLTLYFSLSLPLGLSLSISLSPSPFQSLLQFLSLSCSNSFLSICLFYISLSFSVFLSQYMFIGVFLPCLLLFILSFLESFFQTFLLLYLIKWPNTVGIWKKTKKTQDRLHCHTHKYSEIFTAFTSLIGSWFNHGTASLEQKGLRALIKGLVHTTF